LNNLSKVRKEHGKTLEQVGEFFDVSKSTVLSWEKQKDIPPKRIAGLMEFFGVSRDDLIAGAELSSDTRSEQFGVSAALKIMGKTQLIDLLLKSIQELNGANDVRESELLDAGMEIIRELKRRSGT